MKHYDAANNINIKIKCTQIQISPHFAICTSLEVSLNFYVYTKSLSIKIIINGNCKNILKD